MEVFWVFFNPILQTTRTGTLPAVSVFSSKNKCIYTHNMKQLQILYSRDQEEFL